GQRRVLGRRRGVDLPARRGPRRRRPARRGPQAPALLRGVIAVMTVATLAGTRWKDVVAARSDLAKAFIDGVYVDAASGETLPCVSPVSGETLSHIAACGPEDVDRAVAVARRAFEDGRWSELSPRERK